MLEVTTRATSTALTTIERARQVLGCSPAVVDDPKLSRFIGDASRVVADHCRCVFALEAVRETFIDSDLRAGGPILARSPVVEITRVLSNAEVVMGTGYRLDTTTGRLWRTDADGHVMPWWGGHLTVEYRAGYVLPSSDAGAPASTLPEPIERAANMLVGAYVGIRGRDPTIKTESTEGVGSVSYWVPGASDKLMSPEAEQLLLPYVRFYP